MPPTPPSTISSVAAPFAFAHRLDFSPENSDVLLRSIPAAPGVFSLRGPDTPDGKPGEPYLTRAADIRRRLRRLLAPPEALDESGQPVLSKRLNLRNRVRTIEYTRTGSDFESTLLLYQASRAAFGPEEARRRLRLHAPYFLRVTLSHEHPRVYATNRLTKKSLAESFGPFPSRAAADRYCDAVLDLFLLRRCYEDLEPYPEHPGCVYGEMHKCMEPCKQACTTEQYTGEAQRVFAFFTTRGESLLTEVASERNAASDNMDFETAANLHKHWEKVRAASLLADELIRPLAELRAVILQESAPNEDTEAAPQAAVFMLANGNLCGPVPLSTLGVRAVREQTAVGSSLFAQPLMLAPVPLAATTNLSSRPESAPFADVAERPVVETAATLTPEDRARAALDELTILTSTPAPLDELCDALSLFRRWYYRPEKQRSGEVFLPNPDATWPIRRILNGAARVVLGAPLEAPPVDRDAFKDLKTRVIHAGREGVERTVPVLPKRMDQKSAPSTKETAS